MNPTIVVHYRGHTLAAFEQTGAFIVEVGPAGSDRTCFTGRFERLVDALDSARAIVDWQSRVTH